MLSEKESRQRHRRKEIHHKDTEVAEQKEESAQGHKDTKVRTGQKNIGHGVAERRRAISYRATIVAIDTVYDPKQGGRWAA